MKILMVLLLMGLTVSASFKTQLSNLNSQNQQTEELAKSEQLKAEVVGLFKAGKLDEALPLAKQLLELNERTFGPNALMVANAASGLAELYIAKGKFKEAEPLLLRAVEINDTELKPDDPSLIRTLENYTCILHLREQDSKLKDFETRRLAVLERSPEPDRFWGALWRVTKPTNVPKPDYPPGAKGIASGRVLIEVIVDETGKVISAHNMCGGNVLLVGVSLESANKAQFKPVAVQGKPVRVIGYLPYRFEYR